VEQRSGPHAADRSRAERRGPQGHEDRRDALGAFARTAGRDLAAWRLASGPLVGEALVFPTRDGELWRDHDWANWRRRVFDPLAATAGVSGMRPYDLRHAFCSLLIGEGLSVVEVARQAGHAPTMTLAREHIREARDHRWVGQQHRRHADREREPTTCASASGTHARPLWTSRPWLGPAVA